MRISLIAFLFVVLIFLFVDRYIYHRLVLPRFRKPQQLQGYWIANMALLGGICITLLAALSGWSWIPEEGVMWSIFLYLVVTLPKITYSAIALLDGIGKRKREKKRTLFSHIGMGMALLLFIAMGVGATYGRRHIQTNRVTLESALLPPAFEGYRIVQLSDTHLRGWASDQTMMQRIGAEIEKLHPDLILFTGDLVNRQSDELDEALQQILASYPSRDGIYAILGNHDYGNYVPSWSEQEARNDVRKLVHKQNQMGWRMLNNDHAWVHREGDSIAVIGVENWGKPPFPQYGDLQRSYPTLNDSIFKVLLSHDPTHWRAEVLTESNIALTLSGHTHAMQAKLPCGERGLSLSRLIYPEWFGLYQEGEQHLYVNQGVGYVGIPMRLGTAFPEITLIELHSSH